LKHFTVPSHPVEFAHWLTEKYRGAKIETAYEAGFSGFVLHRALVNVGVTSYVVNPASIPLPANNCVKTNKKDGRRLCQLVKTKPQDDFTPVHVPTVKQELERLIPRTRQQLVEEKTRLGNQIKAKLFEFGFIDGNDERTMSLKLLTEFEAIDLPAELTLCVKVLGTLYRHVHQQVLCIEKEIEKQSASHVELDSIYLSAPGIGPISTATLRSELGDMSQFNNERQLFSYTGLTPSEFSTGDKVKHGGITRKGNTHVRHCLIEVAWRAIGEDPALRKRYDKLKIRRGGKRAIVAIARQLVGQLRACLRQNVMYRTAQAA
jgi:transposase